MIPSWELAGRGNKELQPPLAVSAPPAAASRMFSPSPDPGVEVCVGLLVQVCGFQTPSLQQDESVSKPVQV